jgi:hypothetical protein
MYRSIKADKDAYITDRIIKGAARTNANTGEAGTLDLYKLYGLNKSGSALVCELTRLLVHFDLASLRADYAAGLIDIASPTFNCSLKLSDVYGGQSTPRNFTLKVYPLSRSWDEGRGRDVVFYQDGDVVNFLTASYTAAGGPSVWFASGANAKGLLGSANIDVISSASLGVGVVDLSAAASFVDGTEDLVVDVTRVVSATLAGQIPDCGFRVSFTESQEEDQRTRFVKRFASRQAVDYNKRPQLIAKYDDSKVSHQSSFFFDAPGTLFMQNYVRGAPANAVSGSAFTPVTGANCMLLKLWTYYSSSSGYLQHSQSVLASQHAVGSVGTPGLYSATFTVASNSPNLRDLITNAAMSGSNRHVKFNQVWGSLDGTVAYHSASLNVRLPDTTMGPFRSRQYQVNVPNTAVEYQLSDVVRFRCFVFDRLNPQFKYVRVPQEEPSLVMEAYYSIRDSISDEIIVPFDRAGGSTKMSADSEFMYFDVWMESLCPGRSYVLDVMLVDGGQEEIYYDASPPFRVSLD